MRTVLDLIREFGALNDAKVRRGGTLAAPDEERWQELKKFYDLLMSQKGLLVDATPAHSKTTIQTYVTDRARLRVPAKIYVVLRHDDIWYAARVVNLSGSGVFLASQALFETGTRVGLYLANADGINEDILEIEAEVIWFTERGVLAAELPRGMGLRFIDPPPEVQETLDSWVLETLETRLSTLW